MEPDQKEQRCHRPKAFDKYTFRVDKMNNGERQIDIYTSNGAVCDEIIKHFPKTWDRLRKIIVPPLENKCFGQKMEALVREMQDRESRGVPVRSQKVFLTSIPAAFMGYDLIEWLILRLEIEESEALSIANQMCQYGYFFPISDSKNFVVKDDSSLYRFQSPFYWPWRNKPPDNVDYAIYLMKRSLRNKQRHGLEEYEAEAFANLKRNLSNKWDAIKRQAEEQVKLLKSMKKPDKRISDSQEKAYWRVHRPPPGSSSPLEQVPLLTLCWNGVKPRKKTIEDWKREVEHLRASLDRTRIKVSQALESLMQHVDTYTEFDTFMVPPLPSNPWVNEDVTYWILNAPLVDIPTEKRVRKWTVSLEDLLSDPTGVQEFTNYLQKEKSEENILFWLAVNDLRRSSQSQVLWKIKEIYENYVKLGSPREVNIDNQTMDKVLEGMKNNSRFCFDAAQEHVYKLLLKKDCYPRFIRSDYYKNLLTNGVQPLQKKRFFGFGPTKKKISTTSQPSGTSASSQSTSGIPSAGALSKRRGSDRSLSGSAHDISHFGVSPTTQATVPKDSKVPHSHSQSNLSDIPYRGDLDLNKTSPVAVVSSPVKKTSIVAEPSTSEEVCPWDTSATPPRTPIKGRKTSARLDSESSSSDVSVGISEISEKVQRSLLIQQHTLDCDKKLHVDTYETPRRASVSVPIRYNTGGVDCRRRKVSSFEDNTNIGPTVAVSSVFVIPSDLDNNKPKDDHSDDGISISANHNSKVLQKSHCFAKTCSISSGAPIISVSSASDEVVQQCDEPSFSQTPWDVPGPSQSEPTSPLIGILNEEGKAPLAEPDSESPASELPPMEIPDETTDDNALLLPPDREQAESVTEDSEARNTDVCPWEDEESCKVNTPFVKKYATLGYL